ncbi:hypothetical protein CIT26_06055 [Mesorhizobium temperatum]|uniref:Uncharacterized protein n=1 Tax=Mesorhizobium temperatum TaxID=241416 RepID=A0A271LRS0_9HYPH|nr:hypothetical protein CIT26_06055 [Mesorhizobium temperatum]
MVYHAPIGIETDAEPPQNLFSESAIGRLLLAASLTVIPYWSHGRHLPCKPITKVSPSSL